MTWHLTVRPATLSDDDDLGQLDSATADPGTYVAAPTPSESFLGDSTRASDVLVAEAAGRLVGYVKIRPPTPMPSNAHVQQIRGLAVHPTARRRGVARALVGAALAEAKRRGARKLSLRVLASNPGAVALCEASGFRVEGVLRGEVRIDDGTYVDDMLMGCPLT